MDADTITAASAVVIAILALVVSIIQTQAIRDHNRRSIRPMLQLRRRREYDGPEAGLGISNRGFGPAVIIRTEFSIDGRPVGQWEREFIHPVLETLPVKPKLLTLPDGTILQPGFDSYLIHLPDYDHELHKDFWELIYNRLRLVIYYESVYGGENYRTVLDTRPRHLD